MRQVLWHQHPLQYQASFLSWQHLPLQTPNPCYSLLYCQHYGGSLFHPHRHTADKKANHFPPLPVRLHELLIQHCQHLQKDAVTALPLSPDSHSESMLMPQGKPVTSRFLNPKASFVKNPVRKNQSRNCIVLAQEVKLALSSKQHLEGRSLPAMLRWVFLAEIACLNLKKSYLSAFWHLLEPQGTLAVFTE